MFAVHKATRQTHQPLLYDWKLAKRVAHYQKGTRSMKLNMTPRNIEGRSIMVESYSDADFAADKSDTKSLPGGTIILNSMGSANAQKNRAEYPYLR